MMRKEAACAVGRSNPQRAAYPSLCSHSTRALTIGPSPSGTVVAAPATGWSGTIGPMFPGLWYAPNMLNANRPVPVPDDSTEGFWEAARRGVLALQHCPVCGSYQHPPQPICLRCHATALEFAPVSG